MGTKEIEGKRTGYMSNEFLKKRKFDLLADRIGPDIPFTHWRLYFKKLMISLCKEKFNRFHASSEFRPGAYAIGCSQISIGERVVIRPGTMFQGEADNIDVSILIEDDVLIGSGVHIYVQNHRFGKIGVPIIEQGYAPGEKVILRKGCWIGANSILLPGITIGENAVVGAGSIVTKSVDPYAIVGGNPAKLLNRNK